MATSGAGHDEKSLGLVPGTQTEVVRWTSPSGVGACTIVWLPIDRLDTQMATAEVTEVERHRAGGYTREGERLLSLGSAWLTRRLVAISLDVAPLEAPISRACARCSKPHGRPVVGAQTGAGQTVHVSASHSRGLVGVALSTSAAVGLDVEDLQSRGTEAWPTVWRVLGRPPPPGTPTSGPQATRAAATAWVHTEAVLKATGRGLTVGSRSVDVAPGAGPRVIRWPWGDPDGRVSLFDLQPGQTGPEQRYVGALAVIHDESTNFSDSAASDSHTVDLDTSDSDTSDSDTSDSDTSVDPLVVPAPAPRLWENVAAAPTRRAVLSVAGGLGLAAFLAACDVTRPTASPNNPAVPAVRKSAALPFVRITTVGTTFSPSVELAPGSTATVSWAVEGGAAEGGAADGGAAESGATEGAATTTATGTDPTMSFATAAVRHVRLTVTDGGANALKKVTTLNLGFNHLDDAGTYNMGGGYDKAAQSVTRVENVSQLTGLLRFAAAHTQLAGALDFTGCSQLEYIECISSDVESVNLSGCTSLLRLVLEHTNLTTLNLNPVAANLRDLRAAVQKSGTLTLTPLTAPLAALYHFCVRDQILVNHPTPAQLPVVEERWTWNTGQSGALTAASSAIRSLDVSGNRYTAADLTNQFPAGRDGTLAALNNNLTTINLTGCSGLQSVDLSNNSLSSASVDAVLAVIQSWGTAGGTLILSANSAPSLRGRASGEVLTGRGWTVSTAT